MRLLCPHVRCRLLRFATPADSGRPPTSGMLRSMLGFGIFSWFRFFVFGLIAGTILALVHFTPIAVLGTIAAGASLLGLILALTYARSYEPWAWRRTLVRLRQARALVAGTMGPQGRHQRPLLSP